jgi:hypothetical protein
MSAEPIMEPVMQADPIDLLNTVEDASPMPLRPEYVEGTVIAPPQGHRARRVVPAKHTGAGTPST